MVCTAYHRPRNRAIEYRIVAELVREHFDTNKSAALEAEWDEPALSRATTGQAPLDLNRIALWPWRVKRELLVRLMDAWVREYLDHKEQAS